MSSRKRRLVFVIQELNAWGGQDRSTLEIARRMSRRWGVDLCVFGFEDPAGTSGWGDVRVRRIRPALRRPALLRHAWFHAATLPALTAMPRLRGEPRPLVHATGACSLVSDVIQVQWVNAAWEEARHRFPPAVYRAPGARSRGWVLGAGVEAYHSALMRYNLALERQVFTRDKTYIAISSRIAGELNRYFGLRERVKVVPHGVDSEIFAPAPSGEPERESRRQAWGVKPGEQVAILVGAFERKGLAVSIDALARLPETVRLKSRLVAVGSGETRGFREQAARAGVADRVVFESHTRDVAPLFRAADLFLLPTLYEPFGLVIFEAMASGLPVLVSRCAGAAEWIRDGECGRLLDRPDHASEVAATWADAVRDLTRLTLWGAEARRVAVSRNWDTVARDYENVLAPLMEGGRS